MYISWTNWWASQNGPQWAGTNLDNAILDNSSVLKCPGIGKIWYLVYTCNFLEWSDSVHQVLADKAKLGLIDINF